MRKRSVHTRRRQGLSAIALITVLTIPGTAASVSAQLAPVTRLDLRVTSALLTQAATSGQAAGAQNAALCAAAVLALSDPELAQRLDRMRREQTRRVLDLQLPGERA